MLQPGKRKLLLRAALESNTGTFFSLAHHRLLFSMLLRSLFSSLSRSQLPFSPSLFLPRSIAGPTSPWLFPSCRQTARFGSVVRASSAATGDSPRPPDAPSVPRTASKVLLALVSFFLPLNHDLGHSFHAYIPLYDSQKLEHDAEISH